jgi:hypothetical protein
VVPVVYCYMDDLASWFKRLLGHPDSGSQTPAR